MAKEQPVRVIHLIVYTLMLSGHAFGNEMFSGENVVEIERRAALAYERGDYGEIYRLGLPLAEAGHPLFQFSLGDLMVSGDFHVTNRDRRSEQDEGYEWLLKAAENGSHSAVRKLAAIRKGGWYGIKVDQQLYHCWRNSSPHPEMVDIERVKMCRDLDKRSTRW